MSALGLATEYFAPALDGGEVLAIVQGPGTVASEAADVLVCLAAAVEGADVARVDVVTVAIPGCVVAPAAVLESDLLADRVGVAIGAAAGAAVVASAPPAWKPLLAGRLGIVAAEQVALRCLRLQLVYNHLKRPAGTSICITFIATTSGNRCLCGRQSLKQGTRLGCRPRA